MTSKFYSIRHYGWGRGGWGAFVNHAFVKHNDLTVFCFEYFVLRL